MKDECIWGCGRLANSREDVLAEWIRDYLKARVSDRKVWHLRDLTPIDSRVPTLKNPRPGPRRYLRVRTEKVVCADCNRNWMSRLQQNAKPTLIKMFDGAEVTLGPSLQSTLLSWATMTAICNHYSTELEVDRSRRDYLYKTHSPPPYTEVFAAYVGRPTLDTMHGAGGWRDKLGKTPRAYIDLFGIRHAAFLICQGPVPGPARAVLDRISEKGVTLKLPVDLSRTIEWPLTAITTEAFGQAYDDILTSLVPESG